MTAAERQSHPSLADGGGGRRPDEPPSTGDQMPAPLVGRNLPPPHDAAIDYREIPFELAEGLRGILNRHELRTGATVPAKIAVTAALHGEGATTISQALAAIIAQEMNRLVCWVDCGWLDRNAPAPESDQPSLLELLADPLRIVNAFESAPGLPRLISLAPGPVPDSHRNMIVRSPEFEQLLSILADEVDHVVFDVPPVLSNANGLALIRRADASLVVTRHRSTTIAQVEQVVEALRPTPNLGIVVNQFRTRIPYRLRRILEA